MESYHILIFLASAKYFYVASGKSLSNNLGIIHKALMNRISLLITEC
jgi:hypothetical protein